MSRNTQKEIALIEAIRDRNIEKVQSLIKQGVDLNAKIYDPSDYGIDQFYYFFPILHFAIKTRAIEIAKLLVNAGADINYKYTMSGMQAIHRATLISNIELMEFLIKKDDNLAAKMRRLLSIVIEVGFECTYEAAALLFKHGAKKHVNEFFDRHLEERALHNTTFKKDIRFTQLFLENGADPNCMNISGNTPLHLAAKYSLSNHIPLLLEYGADPLISNKDGLNALDIAKSENKKIIEEYLKRRAAAITNIAPSINLPTCSIKDEKNAGTYIPATTEEEVRLGGDVSIRINRTLFRDGTSPDIFSDVNPMQHGGLSDNNEEDNIFIG